MAKRYKQKYKNKYKTPQISIIYFNNINPFPILFYLYPHPLLPQPSYTPTSTPVLQPSQCIILGQSQTSLIYKQSSNLFLKLESICFNMLTISIKIRNNPLYCKHHFSFQFDYLKHFYIFIDCSNQELNQLCILHLVDNASLAYFIGHSSIVFLRKLFIVFIS